MKLIAIRVNYAVVKREGRGGEGRGGDGEGRGGEGREGGRREGGKLLRSIETQATLDEDMEKMLECKLLHTEIKMKLDLNLVRFKVKTYSHVLTTTYYYLLLPTN